MPFLLPNQQRQSTEGLFVILLLLKILLVELLHMVLHARNASDTNPQTVKLMLLILQVIVNFRFVYQLFSHYA